MSKNLFNSNTFNSKNIINSNTIDNLDVDEVTVDDLVVKTATITDATITDATITDATVTDATITDATVTDATITDTTITNATITNATTTNATTTNATTTNATIGTITNTELQTASSDIATIQNTVLGTGQVNVSTDDYPHLNVQRSSASGGDAHVIIKGARTATDHYTSQLFFKNLNTTLGTTSTYGRIVGQKTGDITTNIGDLVFETNATGSSGVETMRMKSDNTIEISATSTTLQTLRSENATKDSDVDNRLTRIYNSSSGYTVFDRNLELGRSSNDYRDYYIGLLGNNASGLTNVFCIAGHGGGSPDPDPVFAINQQGVAEIASTCNATAFVDATGDLRTAISDKQNSFQVASNGALTLNTTVTPNLLSVNTTNTPSLGSNDLVLGGGIYDYLKTNYNAKLTNGSSLQLSISDVGTGININNSLSVILATGASQTDFGLVNGKILDDAINNSSALTYTALNNGGIAVDATTREISLDYNNLPNPNTIPRATIISTVSDPQLTISQPNNSRDAIVVIEGRRTSASSAFPSQLRLQNFNSNTNDSRHFFRISSLESNPTNGIGGGIFHTFPQGTDTGKISAMTISSNGNFHMGDNATTFQDDYKLMVAGTINTTNISSLNTSIVIGNATVKAAATALNTNSYLELANDKSVLAGEYLEFKTSTTTSPAPGGVTSVKIEGNKTTMLTPLEISSNSDPHIACIATSNGNDASIVIRGRRTTSTTTQVSKITFQNYDNDIAQTNNLFQFHGRVTNHTTNIGGMVLDYYADGQTRTGGMTMNSAGNFLIGGGTTFETTYKFRVIGDSSLEGNTFVKNLKTTSVKDTTTDGSEDTALNVNLGCCLLNGSSGLGLTSAAGVLQVNSANVGKCVDGASFRPFANGNNVINFLNTANSTRGRVDGTGSNSIRYRTSSDRRLKENVTNMESCWEMVKELQPKKYNWISDKRDDVGFIAQEVYAINGFKAMKPVKNLNDPDDDKYYCCDEENMSFDEDGYCEEPIMKDGTIYPHALDYGNFTPYLWKALQEAIVRIEQLETKITEIEGRM